MEQIEILARRVPGLTLLVVDYVGKISPSAQSYRNSDRYNYMTEISGALKAPPPTLKIPILALCQLNRANEASRTSARSYRICGTRARWSRTQTGDLPVSGGVLQPGGPAGIRAGAH